MGSARAARGTSARAAHGSRTDPVWHILSIWCKLGAVHEGFPRAARAGLTSPPFPPIVPGAPILELKASLRSSRVFLAAALAAAGCAHGEIRDGVYHAPKGRYTIQVPAGIWERLDIDGADLALTSKDRSVSILTSTLCGRYRRANLESLSRSLFVGLVDRRVREEETVRIPAGDARWVVVEGRSNGTTVAAEAYTLRADRCLFDFVYLAAPDRFGTGVEAFRAMIRTLRLAGDGSK